MSLVLQELELLAGVSQQAQVWELSSEWIHTANWNNNDTLSNYVTRSQLWKLRGRGATDRHRFPP
uniref:RIKEN cDNA 4930595D18 gene n=1 Tax=Mus spicilegus TaxID=10103 RepID=A0A8C6GPL3_MUSSI